RQRVPMSRQISAFNPARPKISEASGASRPVGARMRMRSLPCSASALGMALSQQSSVSAAVRRHAGQHALESLERFTEVQSGRSNTKLADGALVDAGAFLDH